ncbi:ATP synthase lipid-binding protein, mitochondrial isoform X1 [Ostrea edulis]|uniref:ATP synthase lipid-binding protein, mitochondrial isoform X1 n=1 Tax=Ostrea edulis TaxID=37623 RepID=UPI0020957D48|nr:ATP synthase lipid-binding protein, mitochondrial isoform X1 [Ostrea edulis]XP_048728859.1 ATP synthase lipid-binding protein, mitochondrial isoform X1 [Ostrea edulis]
MNGTRLVTCSARCMRAASLQVSRPLANAAVAQRCEARWFRTTATREDIDQAAKYIGAGAAAVGAAGSDLSSGTKIFALVTLAIFGIGHYQGHLCFTNTSCSGMECSERSGIGTVFGSLIIGYARNPSLKNNLFTYAVLGFALSEAMGLFCFLLAAGILFAF